LLKASREHVESMHAALCRVHGIDIPSAKVEAAGRTDGAIARSILTLAGVPAARIDARALDVRAAACEEFARRCPDDLTAFLNPGVPAVLQGLSARGDLRLSLVTGNLEPVARLKLARAGIGHHFPKGQGAFGSDDDDRAALPPIARRRAGVGRRAWPRERTVVIGDTPRDIACARADGVHVIAIASGPFPAADLAGADAVITDPRDLPMAIDALAP
jgi:phosphoglycolate phosphatase-like HAD superfamily hydrolase